MRMYPKGVGESLLLGRRQHWELLLFTVYLFMYFSLLNFKYLFNMFPRISIFFLILNMSIHQDSHDCSFNMTVHLVQSIYKESKVDFCVTTALLVQQEHEIIFYVWFRILFLGMSVIFVDKIITFDSLFKVPTLTVKDGTLISNANLEQCSLRVLQSLKVCLCLEGWALAQLRICRPPPSPLRIGHLDI